MFEGAPAAQDRAGAELRQLQRCARSRKIDGDPLPCALDYRALDFLSSLHLHSDLDRASLLPCCEHLEFRSG